MKIWYGFIYALVSLRQTKTCFMKAAGANLMNAFVLIAAGIYGYFGLAAADGSHSLTALIPAIYGLVLLVMHKGLVNGNKVIAHVVVVLTLSLLVMCVVRFMKVEEWDAKKYLFLALIISNTIAMIAFIKSFIDARKSRV